MIAQGMLPASRFAVLDLETAPDSNALRLSPGGSAAIGRGGLHRIRAAAVLVRGVDGAHLHHWSEADLAEDEMLLQIDATLREFAGSGGTLVSYNGSGHDLPTLARRAARHWLFDAEGLLGWGGEGRPHFDVLYEWCPASTPRISLRDLAAGLGIPADPGPSSRDPSYAVAKVTTDVMATALAYLHLAALRTRDHRTLLDGWAPIAGLCERTAGRLPNLRQFVRIGHWPKVHPSKIDRRMDEGA